MNSSVCSQNIQVLNETQSISEIELPFCPSSLPHGQGMTEQPSLETLSVNTKVSDLQHKFNKNEQAHRAQLLDLKNTF